MAHSLETKDKVRQLYIEGLPLTGAAIAAGVSYYTAQEWKKTAKTRGDDWDTARAAYQISGSGVDAMNLQLVESFTKQSITTMRELDSETMLASEKVKLQAQLADAHAKFAKSFARLNPQFSGLAVALDTLKFIVDDLRKNDPAALKALHPHFERIGGLLGKRHA